MCKPIKDYLSLLRDYTREIITFGGIALFMWTWTDVRDFIANGNANNARMAEILRTIETRIQRLEDWHAQEHRKAKTHDD